MGLCRVYCINLKAYFCYYCLAFGILYHWMEYRDCDLEPQRAFKSLSILNTSALQSIEAILICKEELVRGLQNYKQIEEDSPFSNHIFFGYRPDSWQGKWDPIIYVVNELCYA